MKTTMFWTSKLQLHYMDCDSSVLSIETQNIVNDLKNLEYLFVFSNLVENHEMLSNKNKKVVGKFKIEYPKNIWIDDYICLRSKACSFKCNDKNTNKLKGISKSYSKHKKFEEFENS